MMTNNDVAQQPLTNAFYFILNLVQTHRTAGDSEWLGLVSCAQQISLYGNDAEKRLTARITYDGSEALKDTRPDNAAKLMHLHVKFRLCCKPLLDHPNSFMEDEPEDPDPAPSIIA